ncbi:MAG: methionine--tRNA ligase [Candidatus Magasanikbacteria bacterium RIFOXYA2_FULL_44_8]|uniref:Methionine--tRNA ligase n=1 Tax=Candidatus Magasanikbacteria bacterium RIFOXYA2_FULL_44_8 TaxID=1798696 RepID=A0A1F6NIH5_9BACT|nr:MAG: methionine--tRNA ligase [Candidatus Magasanikbacteria bacterium RIFOXYA2_FULL_44_8]
MKPKYYLTTTLPYVNAKPHIGFALEIIQADVLARYHMLCGDEVIFNTGTDEHGVKIYRKALEEGKEPQAYCDEYAAKFDALKQSLNLSYNKFIRTTDEGHMKAAQEFWKLCEKNGDIYKKKYQVKYCVGCELEKTDSELVDGKCPVHPNMELELIDEENYFFRFSKYQQPLLDLYDANPEFVVPKNRQLEIRNFVASGLQDFSISRLKEKMPWGIAVPGDGAQVMYVWFDALVNYISTLGWPDDKKTFADFWPGYQVAGKDNLRQQSAMWQAMLMSAGLPTSKQIFIHGFITSGGQKMSKSLGNVIDPLEVVAKYGTDAVRYFLLGAIPAHDDGDATDEKIKEFYGANLANGVGNLNSRIVTMVENYCSSAVPKSSGHADIATEILWQDNSYEKYLANYQFDLAVEAINKLIERCDQIISEQKPWEKFKAGEDVSGLLYQLLEALRHIGVALLPIMPQTAEKILGQFGIKVDWQNFDWEKAKKWGTIEVGTKIIKTEALFPRIQ